MSVKTETDRDYDYTDERDDVIAELRAQIHLQRAAANRFCATCRRRGGHAPGCPEEPQEPEAA